MWQQWINLILGLWIILSAYMGFDADTMTTNLTISGIAIAALALWGALEYRSVDTTYGTHREREHRHA